MPKLKALGHYKHPGKFEWRRWATQAHYLPLAMKHKDIEPAQVKYYLLYVLHYFLFSPYSLNLDFREVIQ